MKSIVINRNIYQQPIAYSTMQLALKTYLYKYINGEWCRKRFTEEDRLTVLSCLSEGGRLRGSALHPEVRLKTLAEMLKFVPALSARVEPWHHLTLCPSQFAVPLKKAAEFDPATMVGWVRNELRGSNFIGVIDAGFYPNLKGRAYGHGVVSWHVHGIIWGTSRKELNKLCRDINLRHEPLFKGPVVAHHDALPNKHNLVEWIRYMLKPPTFLYRVEDHKSDWKLIDKRGWQRPDRAKGGDLMKICNAVAGLSIAELMVATGEAKRLFSDVLQPLS